MKKIFVLFSLSALVACNSNEPAKVDSMNSHIDSTKQDTLNYPYTPSYSSKFQIGDPSYAMTVLKLYKDWDNNTLSNSINSFADGNDTLMFADGNMLAGPRDTILAVANKMRGTMGTVEDHIIAWVSLKSTDKNENDVSVWTNEVRTDSKGKKDSTYLNEVWAFDNSGKVKNVYQFAASPQPPKKK